MSNNLGRLEVTTNQAQKETAINTSDGRLDAALTEENSALLVFSGAQNLKTLTAEQMQTNLHFIVSGTTSDPNPVVKTANLKRGMVIFTNGLSTDLAIEDYGSLLADIIIPAGATYVILCTTTGNRPIVRGVDPTFLLAMEASVKAATTANITLSGAQTIDGVSIVAGDRVLVKNQSTGSQNGVYLCVDPGAWTRESAAWGPGTAFAVEPGGTANGGTVWMLTTPPPIVIGTTSLAFALISSDFFAQFISLTDTFSSYAGLAGRPLRVNATEDGIEATDAAATIRSWINSVRVATDGSDITIATALNSGDTLDGITLANGDRVLVKDQTDETENGIYVVGVTPERAIDFDSDAEITSAAMVTVEEGTVNEGKLFRLTTVNPIVVGVSNIVWAEFTSGGGGSGSVAWKDPVRVATTGNITIATQLNSGDTIDGVTLANGDRVLVKDQSTAADNGIYEVGAVPARTTDCDTDAEVPSGFAVMVQEGTANADRAYKLTTNAPITVGVTGLTFARFAPQLFTELADTFSSYSGLARYWLRVNAATNALEAVAPTVQVASGFGGAPGSSAIVFEFVADKAYSYAAALSGSRTQAKTAATAQADFDVRVNGGSIGTIRWAAAGTVASYVGISAGSLAVGDLVEVVSPASPDATLANLFFNLTLTRAA